MKKVYIVGIGMGNPGTVTLDGKLAIEACQGLVGAERMVGAFLREGQRSSYKIAPEEILKWIGSEAAPETIAVLMSGDVGFFSGAKKLADLIEERCGNRHGNEEMVVSYIPGISSLSYFTAKLGMAWNDVNIVSLHGREGNIVGNVQNHYKTFFLTDGGKNNVAEICGELTAKGLGEAEIHVGERLSYGDEKITHGKASELWKVKFDPLSVILVVNGGFVKGKKITLGIRDEEFVRAKVPMTKEEVRTVTVSKLNLMAEDIAYDIGAGTGSVSVELAAACPYGKVYAIEAKEEATALIQENREKFGLHNLEIVSGLAPEAMEGLPPPDKAFIGGSKGNMRDILESLLKANPEVRVAINAVSLETLTEAVSCMKLYDFQDVEIVELNVSKAKAMGDYNLMMGQNPVYIISGTGLGTPLSSAEQLHRLSKRLLLSEE